MAAAGGAARARRGTGVAAACAAHRPDARRAHAVGRLARRQRRSCSASARASSTPTTRSRSPPRSPRSSRSARRVAWRIARAGRRARAAGARCGDHRRLGDRAARPHPVLGAVARAGDRGRRRGRGGRPAAAAARGAAAERRDGGDRARRLPGRAGGLLGADDRLGAHRLGPVGRAVERRRWRPRWGRVDARRRRRIPGRRRRLLPRNQRHASERRRRGLLPAGGGTFPGAGAGPRGQAARRALPVRPAAPATTP